MKHKLTAIAAVLAIVAAFGIVGGMDYEDAEAQQALYCDNVANGVWPDYDKIYDSECTPERIAEIEEILR